VRIDKREKYRYSVFFFSLKKRIPKLIEVWTQMVARMIPDIFIAPSPLN
jgi:hypothetical protein